MAKRKISYNYLFLKMGEFEQPIENALSTILSYIITNNHKDIYKMKTSSK